MSSAPRFQNVSRVGPLPKYLPRYEDVSGYPTPPVAPHSIRKAKDRKKYELALVEHGKRVAAWRLTQNPCRVLIIHPTKSMVHKTAQYFEYQKALTARKVHMREVVKILYRQLDWDIVATVFPRVFVRGFEPRTITITPRGLEITLGEHYIVYTGEKLARGTSIARILEGFVAEKLLAEVFAVAQDPFLPIATIKNNEKVAAKLVELISKEILRSSTIEIEPVFTSGGQGGWVPVPAILTSSITSVQHINILLPLLENGKVLSHYYPAKLYTMQLEIIKIKTFFPSAKSVIVTVTEHTGVAGTPRKTYLARNSTISATQMMTKMQTPGSFVPDEETTLEAELAVLKVALALGCMGGSVETGVELVKKARVVPHSLGRSP